MREQKGIANSHSKIALAALVVATVVAVTNIIAEIL